MKDIGYTLGTKLVYMNTFRCCFLLASCTITHEWSAIQYPYAKFWPVSCKLVLYGHFIITIKLQIYFIKFIWQQRFPMAAGTLHWHVMEIVRDEMSHLCNSDKGVQGQLKSPPEVNHCHWPMRASLAKQDLRSYWAMLDHDRFNLVLGKFYKLCPLNTTKIPKFRITDRQWVTHLSKPHNAGADRNLYYISRTKCLSRGIF